MVAEGRRLVEDALGAGARVEAVLLAADAARGKAAPLVEEAGRRGIRAEVVARRTFDALADTETPSGVLAVVRWTPVTLEEARPPAGVGGGRRVLVIDGVQDPGNVGTMIRTAFALGAYLTVALEGTADVRSPKVVRGSMGALFRHQVAVAGFDEWRGWAARNRLATWVAGMAGGRPDQAGAAPPPADLALVIGNEGQGARAEWRDVPHRDVTIPMPGGAESLNAAVAAGILLYEVARAAG